VFVALAGNILAGRAAHGGTTTEAGAADACAGGASADVTAAAALDGRTFMTADGREVRLAGVEIVTDAEPAKARLDTLVAGKAVRLEQVSEDRYGRIVAFAFVAGASVERTLLRGGAALASGHIGLRACADTFFAAETEARAARRGLWADEAWPKSAAKPGQIAALKGRFALVEGNILSVRASGGSIYLNFAAPWWSGFSVAIARRRERAFTAAGIVPRQLQGKRIRVRGVVEMRRGPLIEAIRPAQIELSP
jgi:endonuclease YncB( thermonuclease family)